MNFRSVMATHTNVPSKLSQVASLLRGVRHWGPPSPLYNDFRSLFPWDQSSGGVKVTACLRQVPGLRMTQLYLQSPKCLHVKELNRVIKYKDKFPFSSMLVAVVVIVVVVVVVVVVLLLMTLNMWSKIIWNPNIPSGGLAMSHCTEHWGMSNLTHAVTQCPRLSSRHAEARVCQCTALRPWTCL